MIVGYSALLFPDHVWHNQLRLVRIYFKTPTFDRITKDRAAKFVDQLSAIGGTMGLLTGFSIISAVEITYFSAKILFNFLIKFPINLVEKYRISTALMMENPVRSPMVPPIADIMSTNFAALSLVILSNVGVSK